MQAKRYVFTCYEAAQSVEENSSVDALVEASSDADALVVHVIGWGCREGCASVQALGRLGWQCKAGSNSPQLCYSILVPRHVKLLLIQLYCLAPLWCMVSGSHGAWCQCHIAMWHACRKCSLLPQLHLLHSECVGYLVAASVCLCQLN